jgi:hypothetical protein
MFNERIQKVKKKRTNSSCSQSDAQCLNVKLMQTEGEIVVIRRLRRRWNERCWSKETNFQLERNNFKRSVILLNVANTYIVYLKSAESRFQASPPLKI